MYNVSQKYREAMKRPVQRHRIIGTVGTVPFTEADILSGSFSITGQCSDTTEVQIGQVYTTQLKITLVNSLNLPRYTLIGSTIVPYFGLYTENKYEYIPLGIFNITKASWAKSGVEITAYDNISKFDRTFNESTIHGDPYFMITTACKACGLELAMAKSDFSKFANGTRILEMYGDNDIETWRDFVSWIAQTLCCNVFADRIGNIYLRAYDQNPVDTIDSEHRLVGCKFDDFETRYTGISVVDIKEQKTNYFSLETDDALVYNLGSNPFMQTDAKEEMCMEILGALGEVLYVPFTVDMIGNPAYDLMDVLRFEDGFADIEKISCMTKYTFNYNDKYTAFGVGTDPSLASSKSKSDKNLEGLMQQIHDVTESINHLLYDYNTGPITVGQNEQTVGVITYYISQAADTEGHLLFNYVASVPTRMLVRFYDQFTEELYSPVYIDIHDGAGTVDIPHSYLARQTGIHVAYATAQVYEGSLAIDTRNVLFTIDAGNYAQAIDDIAMDVRDITVRQLTESNGPDQVWIVGIEKGKMMVSRREYAESYTSNPKWIGVYSAGEASEAAIEFDGKWVLRPDAVKYTLITDDQPWYFWTTPDNTLYAQFGDDETTKTELDTGVASISACRGYRSNFYLEQDQGLVVAYIKADVAYYVQYVYDTALEAKRWTAPEILFSDEQVLDLRVHRLNDYRISFELTTPTKNLWIYTKRTYVAQAVPKEADSASISEQSMFLYAEHDADLSVQYSNEITDDKLTMYLYVTKQLKYFGSWQDVLVLDDESVPYDKIKSVTIKNNDNGAVITIKLKSTPLKLVTSVTINPDDSSAVQAVIINCGRIKAPKATLIYDTTLYRYIHVEDEAVGIQNTGTNFSYDGIVERRISVLEKEPGIVNSETDMQYALITNITDSSQRVACSTSNTSAGMNYAQVEPSPI